MDDNSRSKLILFAVFFVLLSCCIAYASFDPAAVQGLLGDAISHQITQFTIAFSIAAWLHGGRVKKEIKNQLSNVSTSIDSVAKVVQEELKATNRVLTSVRDDVQDLKGRVGVIEENLKPKQ